MELPGPNCIRKCQSSKQVSLSHPQRALHHQHLAKPFFLLWALSVGGWRLLSDVNWHFPEDSRCWPLCLGLLVIHLPSSVTCLLNSSIHFCNWAVSLFSLILEEFFTYSGYNPLPEIRLVNIFSCLWFPFFHFPHSIVGWAEALIQMESNLSIKNFFLWWMVSGFQGIFTCLKIKARLSPVFSSRSFLCFKYLGRGPISN